MKLASKGDLVITQDYGLASLALAKGCLVMHHEGLEMYTNKNIDDLLQTRYLSAQARKAGKRTKVGNHLRKKIKIFFVNGSHAFLKKNNGTEHKLIC